MATVEGQVTPAPVERGILIDGRRLHRSPGMPVVSPSDGSEVGRLTIATPDDVDAAASLARHAQPSWAATDPTARRAILRTAASLVRSRVDEIATRLTVEQGKPLVDSRKEILFGADVLDYYAELACTVAGSVRQSASPDTMSVVSYSPVGVVAAIVPWNYPVDLLCWKVGPALAAGCAVLVKPPVEAPVAIGLVEELLLEAGLPPGVLADLPGGADVGQALVSHPGVDMVAATCATATGRSIMRDAAAGPKRVLLELGGHAPFVVLPDADIEQAAAAACRRSFSNMGQICIAVNRVIVDAAVADTFVDALAAAADAIRPGDPLEPGVAYGPCTTAAVAARAQAQVDDARSRGATLVTGGRTPDDQAHALGHYYRPTVLDRVPTTAAVMTEETFGPVVAVQRVSGTRDAVEAANATPYGLAAYVYGADLERAWAVADQIEAGGVGITVNDVSELQAPFGGWKHSGIGTELGPEGLHGYLRPKHTKLRRRPLR